MRVAVNSHALPVHKKNRITSLVFIFETIIHQLHEHTVVPTKSDSDIIFCLQFLSETLTCIVVSKMHSNEAILFFL